MPVGNQTIAVQSPSLRKCVRRRSLMCPTHQSQPGDSISTSHHSASTSSQTPTLGSSIIDRQSNITLDASDDTTQHDATNEQSNAFPPYEDFLYSFDCQYEPGCTCKDGTVPADKLSGESQKYVSNLGERVQVLAADLRKTESVISELQEDIHTYEVVIDNMGREYGQMEESKDREIDRLRRRFGEMNQTIENQNSTIADQNLVIAQKDEVIRGLKRYIDSIRNTTDTQQSPQYDFNAGSLQAGYLPQSTQSHRQSHFASTQQMQYSPTFAAPLINQQCLPSQFNASYANRAREGMY